MGMDYIGWSSWSWSEPDEPVSEEVPVATNTERRKNKYSKRNGSKVSIPITCQT